MAAIIRSGRMAGKGAPEELPNARGGIGDGAVRTPNKAVAGQSDLCPASGVKSALIKLS